MNWSKIYLHVYFKCKTFILVTTKSMIYGNIVFLFSKIYIISKCFKRSIYCCYIYVKPHQRSILVHFNPVWFNSVYLVHFNPVWFNSVYLVHLIHSVHCSPFIPFQSILVYFGPLLPIRLI